MIWRTLWLRKALNNVHMDDVYSTNRVILISACWLTKLGHSHEDCKMYMPSSLNAAWDSALPSSGEKVGLKCRRTAGT